MSTNSREKPRLSGRPPARLQRLYQQYAEFMKSLHDAQPRGRSKPSRGRGKIRNFAQFEAWWRALDQTTRMRCATDYRKGYDQSIREATDHVGQLLRRSRTRRET